MNLAQGDVAGFDPRRDIPALLDTVRALLAAGESAGLRGLLAALAQEHPMALAEVACGSRSPGGPELVAACLEHIATLEKTLSPRGTYPRLAELAVGEGPLGSAGGADRAVLTKAAERHPAASWLVALSRRIEGESAGAIHLLAASGHPSFAAMCRAHAEVGHREGLVLAAGATGRPEPSAALLPLWPDSALRAAGAALEADPACPVVAWLAAVWGPEPDVLVVRIIPHLRGRSAAVALRGWCAHLPRSRQLLDIVIRGMREPP